ncbi:MAG: hypothetical protein A2161_02735, partial [Candidatus Schekmanbacteria bacterium RBG_13_48_7]
MNDGGERIEWRVHPAMERPLAFILVLIFLLFFCIFVYFYTNSNFLTVVSIVILFVSLQTFFFPTDYILDEEGLEIRKLIGSQKRSWTNFRSFYGTNRGIQIST